VDEFSHTASGFFVFFAQNGIFASYEADKKEYDIDCCEDAPNQCKFEPIRIKLSRFLRIYKKSFNLAQNF